MVTTADAAPQRRARGTFWRSDQVRRVLVTAAGALFVVYALALLVPWLPRHRSGLDEFSWNLVLHIAAAEKYQFGRDIVFTYGPWGFIANGFHPETYWPSLAVWLVLIAAFSFVLWSSLQRLRLGWRLLAAMTVIALAPLAPVGATEALLFTFVPLLVLLRFHTARMTPALAVCTLALSLISLVKISFFVAAAAVITVITACDLIRRRVPATLLVYAGGFVLFWISAAQDLRMLPQFLIRYVGVTGGYSETMALPRGRYDEPLSTFLLSAAAFLVALAILEFSSRPRVLLDGIERFSSMAIFLVLLLKAGFVRHDLFHTMPVYSTLLLTETLFVFALWRHIGAARAHFWRAVMLAALVVAAAQCRTYAPRGFIGHFVDLPSRVSEGVFAAAKPRGTFAQASRNFADQMAELRRSFPLPQLTGTVDVYPSDQAVAVAHGYPIRPRPIIDSFAISNLTMGKISAQHLRTPGAPEYILFDFGSVWGRNVAFVDALSWPELMTRYSAHADAGNFLILKKQQVPGAYRFRKIGAATADLDGWMAVPNERTAPIWAAIQVDKTIWGKLVSLAFKIRPPDIEVRLEDGATKRMQFIPEIAARGFLLSPMVDSRESFRRLIDPSSIDNTTARLSAFRIVPWSRPRFPYYEDEVRIAFYLFERGSR